MGSFSIPALPGTYGVDVDPSSYDGSGTSDMEFQSTAGLDLTNGDLTNQLITLPPLVGLTVVVTDSNGNPVQGAGISFDGLSGCTGLPSLQGVPGTSAGGYEVFSGGPATDATGSSTMLVVPCQTPQDGETSGSITVYVTAPAGSNYVNTQTTYSGSFESATTVSVTIPTGVVYSGRVVDSQGNPVSGAEIARPSLQAKPSSTAPPLLPMGASRSLRYPAPMAWTWTRAATTGVAPLTWSSSRRQA